MPVARSAQAFRVILSHPKLDPTKLAVHLAALHSPAKQLKPPLQQLKDNTQAQLAYHMDRQHLLAERVEPWLLPLKLRARFIQSSKPRLRVCYLIFNKALMVLWTDTPHRVGPCIGKVSLSIFNPIKLNPPNPSTAPNPLCLVCTHLQLQLRSPWMALHMKSVMAYPRITWTHLGSLSRQILDSAAP